MERLARDETNKIIELIRKGVSLNRVSNKLSRSKITIYYYYKKLNKRRKLKVDFQNLTNKELGYMIGLFADDGNLDFRKSNYSYRVVFNFNLKSESKIKKKLFTIIKKSGLDPFVINYSRRNTQRLVCISKKLYEFLKNFFVYTKTIRGERFINKKSRLQSFENWSKEFKMVFISGLIDSDGYVGNYKGSPFVIIAIESEVFSNQITQILKELNTHPTKFYQCKVYRVRIGASVFNLSCKLFNESAKLYGPVDQW